MNLRLFINEDNDHYFKYGPERMTEARLRAYVDRFAQLGVDTIAFCDSGQRTSYRSKVMDAIWDPLPDGTSSDNPWPVHAKALFDAGIDPYQVWTDQCRSRGIHAWLSLRMNDNHHTHPALRFRADRRWFTHPEWTRDPSRYPILPDQDWAYYQNLQESLSWNYARPDVRSLMLALFRENVQRYDVEGIELDFARDFFCLTPGHAREDAHFLTELLRECRKALKEGAAPRQHPVKLAVRVPWTPKTASDWGFDVQTWAREGLIDIVIPSPYWRSFQYDFPLPDWRAAVGGLEVIPAVDEWLAAGPALPPDLTTADFLRGWCDNMAACGASSVYLFNLPYFLDEAPRNADQPPEAFLELFHQGLNLDALRAAPRCYQIGYLDFPSPGEACHSVLPANPALPVEIHLPIGDAPSSNPARIGVRLTPVEAAPVLQIAINGVPAAPDGQLPPEALRSGDNVIRIQQTSGAPCQITNLFLHC